MTQPERDLAEMFIDYAAEFITMGESFEERENRLAAACSAWNIACETPEIQPMLLDAWIKAIQEANPDQPAADLGDLRADMDELIRQKLELFPDIRSEIKRANLTLVDGKTRLEIEAIPLD